MSKHIVTINSSSLQDSIKFEGCSECQTSCQSACKNRKKLKKRKERPCSRSYGREFFNCCREIFLLGAQKNSWIIM